MHQCMSRISANYSSSSSFNLFILNSAISIPYYLRLANELGGDWNVNLTNVISVAVVLIILIVISPNWFVTGVEIIVPYIGLGIGG